MRTGGTRGGWLSLVSAAVELNDEKKRETGGPLALDGRRLFGRHTIKLQSMKAVQGATKERCDRGGACGMGLWRRFGRRIDGQKIKEKNTSRP